MSVETQQGRRRFLANSAMAIAAAHLGAIGCAAPEARPRAAAPTVGKGSVMAFDSIRHLDAGVLNVGYVDVGPPDGSPVILLHGWPYDIHSFVDVVPLLTAKGYRVIVPHLRGYGTTRFLSADTFRNGQPAALAQDAIDLMDALKIDRAVLAGFDWGARTADVVAAYVSNNPVPAGELPNLISDVHAALGRVGGAPEQPPTAGCDCREPTRLYSLLA